MQTVYDIFKVRVKQRPQTKKKIRIRMRTPHWGGGSRGQTFSSTRDSNSAAARLGDEMVVKISCPEPPEACEDWRCSRCRRQKPKSQGWTPEVSPDVRKGSALLSVGLHTGWQNKPRHHVASRSMFRICEGLEDTGFFFKNVFLF